MITKKIRPQICAGGFVFNKQGEVLLIRSPHWNNLLTIPAGRVEWGETLENALKRAKLNYRVNEGDGAFYGPKIDFHIKDSQGRNWQLATIQYDFNFPERFDLCYIGEDNRKRRPIMIHRTLIGALERFIGILLEHHQGALPMWLSPVQAKIIAMNDELIPFAKAIEQKIAQADIRVEGDYRTESVQKKVRDAELQKIPSILVVGPKEKANNTLAVRPRGEKPQFGVKLADFIRAVHQDVKDKK